MMKKYKTALILLTIALSSFGQDMVSGRYFNFFGSKLMLNPDSTFYYDYHFDLSSSWSVGNWIIKSDTIILLPTLVYDTVTQKQSDLLILSDDLKSERITPEESIGILLSSGGQSRMPNPKRLLYKDGNLYEFNDKGKIKTNKIYCPFRQKKFEPYYSKDKSLNGEYLVDFKTDGYTNYKMIFDGAFYKKYVESDTINGELIWVSDNLLVLKEKAELNQNQTELSKLLNKSFGNNCLEISSVTKNGFKFRTTYTGQLHITINEGKMIKK